VKSVSISPSASADVSVMAEKEGRSDEICAWPPVAGDEGRRNLIGGGAASSTDEAADDALLGRRSVEEMSILE